PVQKALFTLSEASPHDETPLIVEVPHAGLDVPARYLANLVAPVRSLGRDADLWVDELYADAPEEGASLLVAHTSRYVVDLNRAETDWDDDASRYGGRMPRGLVWRLTTDGEPSLARPITRAELEERIETIHRPYHRALQALIDRKIAKFGLALVLAGHSMPSAGRADPTAVRADVVPGSQGRTTADAKFIDLVDAHARAHGLSVAHDDPYKGGYTTRHYGQPAARAHVVQVELARRLYMDEVTLARTDGFDDTRAWCRALVAKLGQTALG
ncbi:MAG: N-formylglutamate deformylase, partial [Myxococcaceae bacterium]|nr:N-formylglutamate deformylase [Myxococcaceae bacterium]